MKLHQIDKKNAYVGYGHNYELLVSYNTPVAVKLKTDEGILCFRTEKKYSVTTTRHINSWISLPCMEVPQSDIDSYMEK